jgi:hypothetical protein
VIPGAVAAVLEGLGLLQDVLAAAGAGALVGGTLAYRHERRGGRQRPAWIVTRWTWVGAGLGVLAHLVVAVAFAR